MRELNKVIVNCRKCKRLVNFREKVAREKRKQYLKENYWGKPVPGFGDSNAEILVIGLAPAAHGGNRTGRLFTGDKSAEFLFNCLHKVNLANQNFSIGLNDGLKLNNIFITAALKCVPPFDKHNAMELKTCFKFLKEEFKYLKQIKIVLALGKIAFDTCVNFFGLNKSEVKFIHGNIYKINKIQSIIACYHPSPRNVNTGRINEKKMVNLLKSLIKTYAQQKKL